MGLAIHLLGVPRVERDGVALPPPRGRKAWALLAYLACSDAAVGRRHLAGLLFEDAEDPLAALRWNLSELRRLIGDAGLQGDMLTLALEPATYVDVKVVASGTWAEAVCVPGLDHDLLGGMRFAGSPSFDVWLATERRHLQATSEAVLREAALARLAAGAAHAAADLAARLVGRNPLDENFQALLVRSLAAAGDGLAAARQVAACRALFARELGVQPGATLDAAARTVTASPTLRPAVGRAAVVAQIDAGEAAIGAGALDAGLQCLRRAIVESDATGNTPLRVRARVALGSALVRAARGRDEEGATALHEAIEVGQDVVPSLAAAACRELGYVEFLRGRYERALVWLRRALPLAVDDRLEQARIAVVHGSVLSDTAHYREALAMLDDAATWAGGDAKQHMYALSMSGRALLLRGDLDAAAAVLDRSVELAGRGWTAFMPWPQSLRAEIDLLRGDVDRAAESFDHAFALGCQLGDPCWEGIAGCGRGRVAIARGDRRLAVDLLLDAIARCARLPDAYVWARCHALDVLCELAVSQPPAEQTSRPTAPSLPPSMPQASAWIADLQGLAARSGMREFTVRAHLHRAALGDGASGTAARLLALEIDSPALQARVARTLGGASAAEVRLAHARVVEQR